MPLLTTLPAWHALEAHARTMRMRSLRELFATDPSRGDRLAAEAAGFHLDYSRQRVDAQTLRLLLALAEARDLAGRRDAMFRGERINRSEDRAALHVALRMPRGRRLEVDGVDVVAEVHAVRERMAAFAEALRAGEWRGHGGRPIRNIVNIGIGGSDLGPVLAADALRAWASPHLRLRFASNMDASDLADALADLDAAQTLFVVCSKTFTTLETMSNALAARAWLLDQLGAGGDQRAVIARHFVAVSSNAEEVARFGIAPENVFGFRDWVGGRYSLASPVGLSTMLAIGPRQFDDLLAGFHAMDEHFRTTPAGHNLPLLVGLLAVWNVNFLGATSIAVLPYAHALRRFPAYLQQLAMESNGKGVSASGEWLDFQTSPVYWGEPGTNGQHSFYQLLHQGTQAIPVDLIGFCRLPGVPAERQDLLMSNLFAQGEALARGRGEAQLLAAGCPPELVAHRICPGNRPSNTLLGDELSPQALGALIALYEHATFVQGVIWGIDSFDQWGVELGKELARRTAAALADDAAAEPEDSSTRALLRRYRSRRAPS